MLAKTSIAHAVCALTLISLTACGGGSNDVARNTAPNAGSNPSATPNTPNTPTTALDEAIVVEAGSTAATPAGSQAVTGGSAGSITLGAKAFSTNALDSEALTVGVSIAGSNTSQYLVVAFEPATGQNFACKGGTWSADEIASIKAQLGDDVPACGAGVSINLAQSRVDISKLSLASVNGTEAKTLILSTAMKWTVNATASGTTTLPTAVGTVVEGLIAADPEKTYTVSSGESAQQIVAGTTLRIETQFTDAFNIAVAADLDDATRYMLVALRTGNSAAYACAGGNWPAATKQAIETALGTGVVPACPTGITADVLQGVLKMNQVTLSTNTVDAEPTVVLSANLDFSINTPAETEAVESTQ